MSTINKNTPHQFNTVVETDVDTVTTNSNHPLLLPYPQGCLQWCKNGMIIAAGGGGPTRSGKPNGFEILQFIRKPDNTFELKRHSSYKTGLDIVYCITQHPLYPYQFIAGIGNNLVIIEISATLKPEQNNAFKWDWNTISKLKYPSHNLITRAPINTIYIQPHIEIQSLPGLDDDVMWVNRVALSSNGKLIASGGTDGIVRLWKYDFVDPNNTLCLHKEINITQKHYALLETKRNINEEVPIIERLLFYDNTYLSICNREFGCYIWNIDKGKIETILMDKKDLIFRDCAFINDTRDTYCICAVNGVRKSRKSRDPPSYLYQYYIPQQEDSDKWYLIHYCKITRGSIIRMIADVKTSNIITLHSNGMVYVVNGLNLNKLYSLTNAGMFFTDIAVSPNLYGNRENNYTEYLLSSFQDNVSINPIQLKPCRMQRTHHSMCFSFKCCVYMSSVMVVLVGILIALMQ